MPSTPSNLFIITILCALSVVSPFAIGSVGCAASTDIRALVAFRFIQAIGGCSAGVSSWRWCETRSW